MSDRCLERLMDEKIKFDEIANDEWYINKNPALLIDDDGNLMSFKNFTQGVMKFIENIRDDVAPIDGVPYYELLLKFEKEFGVKRICKLMVNINPRLECMVGALVDDIDGYVFDARANINGE